MIYRSMSHLIGRHAVIKNGRELRKTNITFFLGICVALCVAVQSHSQSRLDCFQYISPLNGAGFVSNKTNIIIRPGELLDINDIMIRNIAELSGSISGNHDYDILIADDHKTIILKPLTPFAPGERVTVDFSAKFARIIECDLCGIDYGFTISSKKASDNHEITGCSCQDNFSDVRNDEAEQLVLEEGDPSLPANLHLPTINILNNPDEGYIFIAKTGTSTGSPYILLLDNTGYPIFYKMFPFNINALQKHPDGLLAYNMKNKNFIYVIDQTYTVVDSFTCGNGYTINGHEFQMIDSGHVLVMAYDTQTIDMSEIVPGGNPSAQVIGLIIQELDSQRNVVFQWRSWDHFEITDATYIDFTSWRIDYVHGNAIELDDDGNILISSRHMDEITKINRQTGDIIWRLGGLNNEFIFSADSVGFTRQHDIRRIDNGNITLFDNGNFHVPQYSRAVEYELDEVNLTCTLVWEYRDTPDNFGDCCGNVQRLPGGNTVISWGGPANPTMTEINPAGEKELELTLNGAPMQWTYRTLRIQWDGVAIRPHLLAEPSDTGAHLIFNKFGDSNVVKYYIYMGDAPSPTTIIDSTSYNYYDIEGLFQYPGYYFRVTAVDSLGEESPFSNEVEVDGNILPPREYLPGDANMNIGDWPPSVIGSDVTYLVNYFRILAEPCLLSGFYCSADINGDCLIIGSDVTKLVSYFRGTAEISSCVYYESAWPTPDDLPAEEPDHWPNCEQ